MKQESSYITGHERQAGELSLSADELVFSRPKDRKGAIALFGLLGFLAKKYEPFVTIKRAEIDSVTLTESGKGIEVVTPKGTSMFEVSDPQQWVDALALPVGQVPKPQAGSTVNPDTFKDDPPIARVVRTVDGFVGLAEQILLFGVLLFLVLVTLLWFITENFTKAPLENASYDIRYGVFLMAMVGGGFATHHRRLLSMDVLSHLVSPRVRGWIRVLTNTFAAFMAGVFLKYGLYIYNETSKEKNISHWMPASAANGAMALGAALILFHLVVQIAIDLDYLGRGRVPPEPEMGAA